MELRPGTCQVIDDLEIDFSTERILGATPFSEWTGTRLSGKRLEALIEQLRPSVRRAVDARAAYAVMQTADSGLRNHDPPVPLCDTSFLCCLLVTVGRFSEDDGTDSMVEEMVRDALENVALRFVKRTVALKIRDRAQEQGWNTTRLFSPGSGSVEWDVTHSSFVFEHVEAAKIDVSLGTGGIIQPPKSISSVIGLGPDVEQAPNLFTCEGCSRIPDCDYAITNEAPTSIRDS